MNDTPPPFKPQEASPQAVATMEPPAAIDRPASEPSVAASPANNVFPAAESPTIETPAEERPAAEVVVDSPVAELPSVTAGLDADTVQRIADLLADAEARGYLRGRNEKIEATQHFAPEPDVATEPERMPVYAHHSIWDSAG